MKSNKAAIETLEEYVNAAKGMHDFTYNESVSGSDQASRNIYELFTNIRSYYNHIIAHLASVTPEGIENTMLTTEEFEVVKNLILCGFMPAEAVYWHFAKGKPIDFDSIDNAWLTYAQLELYIIVLNKLTKKTNFFQQKQ